MKRVIETRRRAKLLLAAGIRWGNSFSSTSSVINNGNDDDDPELEFNSKSALGKKRVNPENVAVNTGKLTASLLNKNTNSSSSNIGVTSNTYNGVQSSKIIKTPTPSLLRTTLSNPNIVKQLSHDIKANNTRTHSGADRASQEHDQTAKIATSPSTASLPFVWGPSPQHAAQQQQSATKLPSPVLLSGVPLHKNSFFDAVDEPRQVAPAASSGKSSERHSFAGSNQNDEDFAGLTSRTSIGPGTVLSSSYNSSSAGGSLLNYNRLRAQTESNSGGKYAADDTEVVNPRGSLSRRGSLGDDQASGRSEREPSGTSATSSSSSSRRQRRQINQPSPLAAGGSVGAGSGTKGFAAAPVIPTSTRSTYSPLVVPAGISPAMGSGLPVGGPALSPFLARANQNLQRSRPISAPSQSPLIDNPIVNSTNAIPVAVGSGTADSSVVTDANNSSSLRQLAASVQSDISME
jgi:hypothetical protein